MPTIKVVVLLVRQLQHGVTNNAKVSPNLTVAHIKYILNLKECFTELQVSTTHPFRVFT